LIVHRGSFSGSKHFRPTTDSLGFHGIWDRFYATQAHGIGLKSPR
jgi:hypothetical protein